MQRERKNHMHEKEALIQTFDKYIPWDENGNFQVLNRKSGKLVNYTKKSIRENTYIEETVIPNIYILRNYIIKNIPKDFSLDELKSTSLREKELSEVRSLAVLAHFLQLQEQASILGNVNKILNADRAKPKFLHQSAVRYNAKTTLEFNDILPKEVLDKLYNNTSTSAFNNQKTGIDKFITQLFGGKQVFDVTNHPTFNEFIGNKWNTDKDLSFTDKYDNEEDWFKTIKNDLISFIYQNYVVNKETNNLVVDEQYKNLLKSKTNGNNISLGDQLLNLKEKHKDLAKNNILLNLLTIDNSKQQNLTNIKLKKDNIDANLSNELTQAFNQLLEFSEYSGEENTEITNFAKNLAQFGFIQSGLNKSPLSFTNIIPQDFYSNNIGQILEEYSKYLDNPEVKKDLEKFYQRFKENNVKFYTVFYEIDPQTKEKYPNIDFNKETYRFKDYRIKGINNQIGNRAEIDKLKEQLAKKDKVITLQYSKGLAEKNPTTLFIYETDKNNSSTGGSGVINETKPKNVFGFPLKNIASSKPEAYFSDNNLEQNKQLIDNAIAKIQDLSKGYKKLAFPEEGFITNVSKLQEKAPITASYLVQQLQSELYFTDKNFDFEGKSAKIVIPEEKEVSLPETKEEVQLSKEQSEAIDFVFEQSPEIKELFKGDKELYQQYLNTIFPDSKVKDVVFHGTEKDLDKFKVFSHFGTLKAAKDRIEQLKHPFRKPDLEFNERIYPVVIDFKNPIREKDYIVDWEEIEAKEKEFVKEGYDGLIYKNEVEDEGQDSYLTFKSEQVHILGNKQDIQQAKQFLSKEVQLTSTQEPIKEEIKPLDKLPDLPPC